MTENPTKGLVFSGATFDSRNVKPGMLFVALKGDKADGHDYIPQALAAGAAGIIDGYDELDRIACEYRRSLKAKVVGITGSAGKTTTKELVKTFLSTVGKVHATEGNYNNHIGLPITILNCPKDADFLVLEMGTNHPGEIAHLCDIAEIDCALVTNVGTAHIEFFGDQDGIAREKGVVLERAREFGVVSKENARLEMLRGMCRGELVVADPRQEWMAKALEGVLPGEHNLSNACLAFALAERFGATKEGCSAALADFSLPGARWRKSEKWGVTFIDDTYNANPDSMIAALDTLANTPCDGKRVAVLGDMFELGERSLELHRKVFGHAMKLGIPLVIGVGEMSSQCLCHLVYKDLKTLKKKFRLDVSAGDLVLLKASHGMHLGELLV
ncbi:MAG: UDP-N-acetylmuramoyl-tripeptide--D-alanyl-D-alanine ligase [Kiritimatiellae bacterium]|nr:UDP-N-acetylmuramoyl-tripeptide--D-alanyl-D-alanine ligase [Kiritimatiellia bacterium]